MISLHHTTSSRIGSRKSTATRQRVSRACDRCNQLRTKCDGQTPCEHCVVFGLDCEYKREQKKRGKASNAFLSRQKQRPSISSSIDGLETPLRSPAMINTSSSSSSADSSAASSPNSLPPSPLFNIASDDDKLDPRLQFIKSENSESYFSSNFFYHKSPEAPSAHFDDTPDSSFMLQPWGNRFADTYDPPTQHPSPTTTAPTSPYVPLCASCHVNPSSRLYPASMFWLQNGASTCSFPYPAEDEGFEFGSSEDGSRKGSL